MNGFYVSLVFFGILLVCISFFWILIDKRKVFNFSKGFDERKQELVDIINDADQMVDEMNKFSDYIVNQIDVKNDEMNCNLKAAEQKIEELSSRLRGLYGEAGEVLVSGQETMEMKSSAQSVQAEKAVEAEIITAPPMAVNDDVANQAVKPTIKPHKPAVRRNEKVIPFNNKYSEVLRLSEEGLQELEIARKLNMGKGEVELIVGLRK